MAGGRWAVILIRVYQRRLSPLIGPHCRFYPTCSQYAAEAYEKYGFVKGSILTILRLARCGPWRPGGVDPVPDDFEIGKLFRRR